MQNRRMRFLALVLIVLCGVQTSWAESWIGGGADDNWTTTGNWNAGDVPENPDTDNVTFSAADSGNTGIVTSNWQIGGLVAWQNTASGGATQTIDLGGNTLTIVGNVHVADKGAGGNGLYSHEIKFTNGALQLGTSSAPVDLKLGAINTANYFGKLSFVSSVTLTPYLNEVRIGFSNNSQQGSGGTLDLRNVTIPGGELKVNKLHLAFNSKAPTSYLLLDNHINGIRTLSIANEFVFSKQWGKARLGHPTGGANDEHKLPAGFTLNIGSASAPASSVLIGYNQYSADGRLISTSGGSFNAYVTDMRLADVANNNQNTTTYGIVDFTTMTSCTMDIGTLVVAKDYGYPGTVNVKAIGQLKLPKGTLEADNVEVGAHKTGSEGLIELDGTSFKINSSLNMAATGTIHIKVKTDAEYNNNVLDLGSVTPTMETGAKIKVTFVNGPPGTLMYYGLAWQGDHVAELTSMEAAGKLVIDDTVTAPLQASIFMVGNTTVIGYPAQITPGSVAWDGGGADDNWSTGDNWASNSAPANPEGNVLNFSAADSGGTGVLTSNWQIGGITAWQNTASSGATQTIDLDGRKLTVMGNVHVADRDQGGNGLYPHELKFTDGTLQLGTAAVPIDMLISNINTNLGYVGKVSFMQNVTLLPYIDELKIGFWAANQNSGGGTLDLRNATIPGGELKVNKLLLGHNSRTLTMSYLLLDNPINGVSTLSVANELLIAHKWGKARVGYATGGANSEHKLPAGFTINIGSATTPASVVKIGHDEYGSDIRMYATSGGSFNVYATDMRLADVVANTYRANPFTTTSIVDFSTMDSCIIDVGTLVVAKDYGTAATAIPVAKGTLKLPAGTFEADTVEVGAHKASSSGLLEFNGTEAKINSSLTVAATGIVRVNVQDKPEGTNGLDLGASTLTVETGGKIELNFTEAPTSFIAYNGLAMDGDHVAELEAMLTAGKLVVNDSAMGSGYEAIIYANGGRTYVGVQWPSGANQYAAVGFYPSHNKIAINIRERLVTTPSGGPGFRTTVYDTNNFTGNAYVVEDADDLIDVDWFINTENGNWKGPAEVTAASAISVKWEGTLGPIPQTGTWMLHLHDSISTTQVLLDDQVVWASGAQGKYSEVPLTAGQTYRLTIKQADTNQKRARLQFRYWLKSQRSTMIASNLTIPNPANPQGTPLVDEAFEWHPPVADLVVLPTPTLAEGEYEAIVSSAGFEEDATIPFVREVFEWEGTTEGITTDILPPFLPVTKDAQTGEVSVVMRKHTQDGLGLWSSVKACINDDMTTSGYKELLAGPIVLKVNGTTLTGTGSFDEASNNQAAIYNGSSSNGAIEVDTHCETYIDGAMKVTMTLGTGSVNSMYLEIPVKNEMAPLFHAIHGSSDIRHNPAYATPAGDGDVWNSTMLNNRDDWRGNFKPYIWLGAEERGLAWFADNEEGWELDWGTTSDWPEWIKNGWKLFIQQSPRKEIMESAQLGNNAVPCQIISRDTANGIVYLRVYFIQKPVTISTPRTITFGLMASPTKPMPANWRTLGRSDSPRVTFYTGSSTFALDATFNAKYPRGKDWSVFENFYSIRQNGGINATARAAWIANWAVTHIDPYPAMETGLVDTYKNLLDIGMTRAGSLHNPGPLRKLTCYFDEFIGTTPWHEERPTFGTEWHKDGYMHGWDNLALDQWPAGPLTTDHRGWQFGTGSFSGSGQDFATWCGKQWLENSVGLYFDNTFLAACTNQVTTNAFIRPDGSVNPSSRIWARRDYLRRIWTLHQQNYNADWPQAMMCHMTNTHILPMHTWNEYNLDLEWLRSEELQLQQKFGHARLRAETLGLQTGSIPVALTGDATGVDNANQIKQFVARSHAGGLYVHEIRGPGFGDKLMPAQLDAFGYGLSDCDVFNYWDEVPMLTASDSNCKWLLLKRNGKLFILLTTWSASDANVTLDVDYTALGVTQPSQWVDAENPSTTFTVDGSGNIVVDMPGYNNDPLRGVRMIQIP